MPYIPVDDREKTSSGYTPVDKRGDVGIIDVLKEVPNNLVKTGVGIAKEVAKAPVRAAMIPMDLASNAIAKKPMETLRLPLIGDVESYSQKALDYQKEPGYTPALAGARAVSEGILDVASIGQLFEMPKDAPFKKFAEMFKHNSKMSLDYTGNKAASAALDKLDTTKITSPEQLAKEVTKIVGEKNMADPGIQSWLKTAADYYKAEVPAVAKTFEETKNAIPFEASQAIKQAFRKAERGFVAPAADGAIPRKTYSRFGDTVKIPERIKSNIEEIETLKRYKKATSRKDGDIREEIQQEIDDLIEWNQKAQEFYDANKPLEAPFTPKLSDINDTGTTFLNKPTLEAMQRGYAEGNKELLNRPIAVVKNADGTYDVVEGQHRAAAARAAGVEPPIVVLNKKDIEGLSAPEVDALARKTYGKGALSAGLTGLTGAELMKRKDEVPKSIPLTRGADQFRIREKDLNELAAVLYGEISNRKPEKRQLEGRIITGVALNRMREKAKPLTDILQEPNQFQAFNDKQYKLFKEGKGDPEKVKAVMDIIDEIRRGDLSNPDYAAYGAYYYKHKKDGSIVVDDERPLFAKKKS